MWDGYFFLSCPMFSQPHSTSTLSMSFQHFSTIFLSTTAGWWGCRGCWWGWKASFIKPMRPAPLLGFPAINSVGDRGLAPGAQGSQPATYSRHVFCLLFFSPSSNENVLPPTYASHLWSFVMQRLFREQNKTAVCATLYATQLAS